MSQNIMLPVSLLDGIIELLGYWDVSKYDYSIRCDYGEVIWALKVKKQKLELRDAYAKIITAKNTDDRDNARIDYMRKRNKFGDVDLGGGEIYF